MWMSTMGSSLCARIWTEGGGKNLIFSWHHKWMTPMWFLLSLLMLIIADGCVMMSLDWHVRVVLFCEGLLLISQIFLFTAFVAMYMSVIFCVCFLMDCNVTSVENDVYIVEHHAWLLKICLFLYWVHWIALGFC